MKISIILIFIVLHSTKLISFDFGQNTIKNNSRNYNISRDELLKKLGEKDIKKQLVKFLSIHDTLDFALHKQFVIKGDTNSYINEKFISLVAVRYEDILSPIDTCIIIINKSKTNTNYFEWSKLVFNKLYFIEMCQSNSCKFDFIYNKNSNSLNEEYLQKRLPIISNIVSYASFLGPDYDSHNPVSIYVTKDILDGFYIKNVCIVD